MENISLVETKKLLQTNEEFEKQLKATAPQASQIVQISGKEIAPKLTITSVKRPVQQNDQADGNLMKRLPQLTPKPSGSNLFESKSKFSSVLYPKLSIQPETIRATMKSSLIVPPQITIRNRPDKTFEPPSSLRSLPGQSSDYTNFISEANKSSLAAANMELIPRSSMKTNKVNAQINDSDDEEIEVIPSVLDKSNNEFMPKLSIKALKQSIQSDREIEKRQEDAKFRSIPSSKSSTFIIKPILNAHLLDDLRADPAPQSLLKTINMPRNNDFRVRQMGGLPKNSLLKPYANIVGKFSPISNKGYNNSKYDDDRMNFQRSHLMCDPLRIDTTTSPLEKITLKLSKEGGHPEILSPSSFSKTISPPSASMKRMLSSETTIEPVHMKKAKTNESEYSSRDVSIVAKSNTPAGKKLQNISEDVTIMRVSSEKIQQTKMESSSKLQEILMTYKENRIDIPEEADSSCSDDVKIIEVMSSPIGPDPLAISNDESSSQDVMIVEEQEMPLDPLEDPVAILPETPKKRGRPRKIPLEVRPELKEEPEPMIEENEIPVQDIPSSAQISDEEENFDFTPKREFNIRGARRGGYRSRRGRGGRGSRGGRGAYKKRAEEKRKMLLDLKAAITSDGTLLEGDKKHLLKLKPDGSAEAFFMEEDTRMSANGELSLINTHIKPEITDESRSSSTTTEHKNKRVRLEVAEIVVQVTGPEQIAEYHWGEGGPYMLQEQIAQYLGVKSFKRKYPGLTRHAVDMQERDYIRENGLASESLCDMGLTAVPSAEILDIMFTDFQDKYEEYRKYQREKQAKDVTNKQRAMATSMATNADKNSKEESVLQKAIRSAASWNASLNKSRKEERKCYLDMQSFVVMYPRGRKSVSQNTNPGDYPIALVPGQFSEYYKNYTPSDLKYLPVNTVLYGPVVQNAPLTEIGYSDGSCSDYDSSSGSDSDSSDDSDSTTMDGITTPLKNSQTLSAEV